MGHTKHGKASPIPEQPAIYYSLHTLLETIRVIKTYEDPLCTLLHAIQSAGGAGSQVEQELQTLLDEMPAEVYPLELHAVRARLGTNPPEIGTQAVGNRLPSRKARSKAPARRARGKVTAKPSK